MRISNILYIFVLYLLLSTFFCPQKEQRCTMLLKPNLCRFNIHYESISTPTISTLNIDKSVVGYVFNGHCTIRGNYANTLNYILSPGQYTVDKRTGARGLFEQILVTIERQATASSTATRFDHAVLEGLISGEHIEKIAERCFMTLSTFKRYFTLWYGTSPHRWYMTCRMTIAHEMITHSRVAISQIAHICGFVNESHFSACYRRYYGSSPSNTRMGAYMQRGVPHYGRTPHSEMEVLA